MRQRYQKVTLHGTGYRHPSRNDGYMICVDTYAVNHSDPLFILKIRLLYQFIVLKYFPLFL